MKPLRTFTTLITLLSLIGAVFLPSLSYAQEGPTPPVQLEPLPPVDIPVTDTTTGILGEVSRGALSLAVCNGGNLTDRLKAAGQGAINGAIGFAAQEGLDALKEWGDNPDNSGWLADLVVAGGTGAIPVVGGLLSGIIGGALGLSGSDGPTVVDAPELQNKENCLDAMARVTSQKVLEYVANGVLTWVQRGFEQGSAGFVANVDEHLRGVADRKFRKFMVDFMNSKAYGDICDAMSDDVAAAISRNHYRKYPDATRESIPNIQALISATQRQQCGFDQVLGGSADNFISGSVPAESWGSWNEMVRQNPYYRYTVAANDLQSGIAIAQNQSVAELSWSGGFISWTTCKRAEERDGDFWLDDQGRAFATLQQYPDTGDPNKNPCIPGTDQIQTPGSVVQNMINQVISSDIRRGELADEFNEVVADAGNWLISNITEEGLRNSSPGLVMNGGAIDEVIQQQQAANLLTRVGEQIRIEEAYLNNLSPLYNQVLKNPEVTTFLSTLESCTTASPAFRERAQKFSDYLYTELDQYVLIKEKIDWRISSARQPLNWKPVIIERAEPYKIDWTQKAFDWVPDTEPYTEDGIPRRCSGSSDSVGYQILPLLTVQSSRVDFEALIELFLSLGDFEPYLDFAPYEVKGPNWDKLTTEDRERLSVDIPNSIELSREYQYVWEAVKCVNGMWRNNQFTNPPPGCMFPAKDDRHYRCYNPAYTPKQARIISESTYQQIGNTITPSKCNSDPDVGLHYFVLNGENTWRIRNCISDPGGRTIKWEDQWAQDGHLNNINPAENLIARTAKTNLPAYREIPEEEQVNPVTSQQELIQQLRQVAALLEGRDPQFEQAYILYTSVQDQFHRESDVTNLQNHIAYIATELGALNRGAVSSSCGGGASIDQVIQQYLNPVAINTPVKIDWSGAFWEGDGWTQGIKYDQSRTPLPAPICDANARGNMYFTIDTISNTQYQEQWRMFQCTHNSTRDTYTWTNTGTTPAWKLYSETGQ